MQFTRSYATAASVLAVSLAGAAAHADPLIFDPGTFTSGSAEHEGQPIAFRAYTDIHYVANPVPVTVQHPDYTPESTRYHEMNIYIPEAYFEGGTINGYTAETAPVYMHVSVGGWMPALPGDVRADALARGYIYASPGTRGYRTRTDTVKHPDSVVDAKAAIRYLRHNDAAMPGDANRLVLTGNSAGSGIVMAAAASANDPAYAPYLAQIGAADVSDHVLGVSPSAFMTSLQNASTAYEWQYADAYYVPRLGRAIEAKEMLYSQHLAAQFPGWVNALRLTDGAGNPLTLNRDGSGSFREHLVGIWTAEAQAALDAGQDLSEHSFLTIADGRITGFDFAGYINTYNPRFRDRVPGFDTWDNATSSQWGFAEVGGEGVFLTAYGFSIGEVDMPMADPELLRLMDPMAYVSNPMAARHWRIRQGMKDNHMSAAMPLILGLMLQREGADVEFDFNFNAEHGGNTWNVEEVYNWIDRIAR